jgi:hypothetical protein
VDHLDRDDATTDDHPAPRVANLKSGLSSTDPDHYRDQPYPPGWIPQRH